MSNELALIKAQVQPNENTLKGNKNMEGWGGGGGGGGGGEVTGTLIRSRVVYIWL